MPWRLVPATFAVRDRGNAGPEIGTEFVPLKASPATAICVVAVLAPKFTAVLRVPVAPAIAPEVSEKGPLKFATPEVGR